MDWQAASPVALLREVDPAIVERITEQLDELGYTSAVVDDILSVLPEMSEPDVVLIGLEGPAAPRTAFARQANASFPGALILGYTMDFTADALAGAMAIGLRRVLPYPFSTAMLRQTIEAVRAELQSLTAKQPTAAPTVVHADLPRRPADTVPDLPHQLIVITSPKGGVGTSTLSVNLAAALQVLGYPTALVDLNLNFASHGVFLDLHSDRSLADLLDGAQITRPAVTSLLVRHQSGLHALLGPEQPEDGERILFEHIQQTLTILRDSFTFTVVDACPCFDGRVLAALEMSNTILVPLCPDLPTMKNTNSYLRVIELLHYDMSKLMLVMMRADSISQHELRDIEAAINREIRLRIASDGTRTTDAANSGTPFVLSEPDAPVSQNVFAVARTLIGNTSDDYTAARPKKQSMVGRFLRR